MYRRKDETIKQVEDDDEEEEKEEEQPAQLAVNTKRSKGSKGVVFQANVRQQTEVSSDICLCSSLRLRLGLRRVQKGQASVQFCIMHLCAFFAVLHCYEFATLCLPQLI